MSLLANEAARSAMTPPPGGDLLRVVGLKTYFFTRYGVRKAVNGVDLTIRRGEAVGLVGESGSGKTMTALSIMRLIPRHSARIVAGQVFFNDVDLLTLPEPRMRKMRGRHIALIMQDPSSSLNPVFTIGSQIAEMLREHRVVPRPDITRRVLNLLRMARIPVPEQRIHAFPHQLSGGMRQRVVSALAYSCNAELIIADEPTTALDTTTQAQFLKLLKDLQRDHGTAMLFITHNLGVVARMCQRIAVMYAGALVEEGTARQVLETPAHPYTKALLRALPSPHHDVERLPCVPGQPPSLDRLPRGCTFAPRCDQASPRCDEAAPPRVERAPGHRILCWGTGGDVT